MAKRTTKSKALGYQETFFANRNDMLQSALDAVLLKIDNEQARYQAEVELYKEGSKLVTRERERLQKLVDSLKKGQIDKNLAVAQFNASQENSTARTAASIEAANARFNAKQAALAAYYGTRGFSAGRDPQNAITLNEAQQAYNANRGNINAAFDAYYQQTQVTTGVPKTADDVQKGFALVYDFAVIEEAKNPKYDIFDEPQDRINAAKDTVFESISKQSSKDFVELGLVKLNPQAAAGAGLVIDETGKVNVGGIDVKKVGQIDYSPLIADAEARLGRIKEAGAKAPVAPKEPDLIDLQRREYFDKFYSGYVPRYEMNEIMQKLIDLPDSEAQAFKDLYQSRYSPVAGMEAPTGARPVRELPTTPGGVIGGEGSPFVPTDRFSDRGREILGSIPGNQFYLEDMDAMSDPRIQSLNKQISELAVMADSNAGPMGGLSPFNIFASKLIAERDALISEALQERANLLFKEGFGLQKTLKEDGRTLYTVVPFDQLGLYPADQVVMPEKTIPFYRGTPSTRIDEVDVAQGQSLDKSIDDLVQELARIDGALKKAYSPGPVSPDVEGLGPVSSKEQVSALESSKRQIEDQLDNLLMRRIEAGSGQEQELRRDRQGNFDFGEPRRVQPPGQPNILLTGDRAEVRRILNDPERQRYKAPFKVTETPAPAPAPEPEAVPPEKSTLELSKETFVTDPTDYDYRYKSDGKGGFEVEFKGKKVKPAPAGSDAAKAIEGVLTAPEIEAQEAPTPEQIDAKVKFDAAEKTQSIYGTPEFDKLLKTELGKAVSDLYSVNKAKGDETGGEILSYIATEFPRADDQSKAAQILMGLSYADKTKGLLKA